MDARGSFGRILLAALTGALLLPALASALLAADSRDCRRRLARAEAKAEAARTHLAPEGTLAPEAKAAVDEAMAAYHAVIRHCPEMIEVYEGLGNLAFSTGRMDDAIHAYRGYLQLRPDSVAAASRLGYVFMKGGRYEEAVTVYEWLLEHHPDRVNDRKQYALALQKTGRTEEAAAQFREIVSATGETKLNCNETMTYVDAKDGDKTIRSALRGLAAHSESEGCLLYGWEKGFQLITFSLVKERHFREARAACQAERARAVEMLSGVNVTALSVIENKVQDMLDRIAKLAAIEANRSQ